MWTSALRIAVLAAVLQAISQSPQSPRRVAITMDDGPVVGDLEDLERFQRISNGLIASLSAGALQRRERGVRQRTSPRRARGRLA